MSKRQHQSKQTEGNEAKTKTVNLLTEGQQRRYGRLQYMIPRGFPVVLDKIIKAVLVARPLNVHRFISDFVAQQLAQRTFNEIVYGCHLAGARSSESCKMLHFGDARPTDGQCVDNGPDAFTSGAVPEYEIRAPALDRYRQLMGIGSLFEDQSGDADNLFSSSHQKFDPDAPITYISMKAHMPDFYRLFDTTKEGLAHAPGFALQTCGCAFCAAVQAQPPPPITFTSMKAHMPDQVALGEVDDQVASLDGDDDEESKEPDISATYFTMKAHMPDSVVLHPEPEISAKWFTMKAHMPDSVSLHEVHESDEDPATMRIRATHETLPEPTDFADTCFTLFGDDEVYEESHFKSVDVFKTTSLQFAQVIAPDDVFGDHIHPEPCDEFMKAQKMAADVDGKLTDVYLDEYVAEALSGGDPAEHQQDGANTTVTLEILNADYINGSSKAEHQHTTLAAVDEENDSDSETVYYVSMKAHMPDSVALD